MSSKLGKRVARLAATAATAVALLAFGTAGEASAAALSGPYLIFNNWTGKCVDIPGYGKGTVDGGVYEYTCDGSDNDDHHHWSLA
ncbi:hypothetical protein AB0F18_19175 [Streptomyces sp. NPDC029216]|uniref:hypothetical protein n=1 Tax=Streptomyces sp. NPDC029216 TaxID=3154701 RepID=UPI0033EB919C